ncbi:MAG: hypothetical protein LBQ24_07240 [Candidatus Peribacteria bacterium]|nr:hypothetical protein [Candidatus Peribacteria bacterium]
MSSYPDAIITQITFFAQFSFKILAISFSVVQVEITSSSIIISFHFIFSNLFLFILKAHFKLINLSSLDNFDCCLTFFVFIITHFSYFIPEIFEKYLQSTSLELYHLFNFLKKWLGTETIT